MAALTHGPETPPTPALVPQFGKSAALVLLRIGYDATAGVRLRDRT